MLKPSNFGWLFHFVQINKKMFAQYIFLCKFAKNKQIIIMNFETINPPRQDGFPKVKDLSIGKNIDKIDINDPNFDKPISVMEKDFKRKQNLILNFKIR